VETLDRVTRVIDAISIWSGRAIAWLILPMILLLAGEVIVRHLYAPTIWALDLAMIFYGTHYFIAGALALYAGKHVRTDFLYDRWSLKTQAWVDLLCYVLLFLPGMVMFVWLSWDFAAESWELKERMMTSWRPPAYWYKSVIPLAGALLLLQGVSELLKAVKTIVTGQDVRHHEKQSEIT